MTHKKIINAKFIFIFYSYLSNWVPLQMNSYTA
jgi:hypothetical protein